MLYWYAFGDVNQLDSKYNISFKIHLRTDFHICMLFMQPILSNNPSYGTLISREPKVSKNRPYR